MQKKEEKELVYYKILEKIMPAHIINAVGKLFQCGPSENNRQIAPESLRLEWLFTIDI